MEHVLGKRPDLLLAGGQILHELGLLGRHQAPFGGRGQQLLFAWQPFILLGETELHYARGPPPCRQRYGPAGLELISPSRVQEAAGGAVLPIDLASSSE